MFSILKQYFRKYYFNKEREIDYCFYKVLGKRRRNIDSCFQTLVGEKGSGNTNSYCINEEKEISTTFKSIDQKKKEKYWLLLSRIIEHKKENLDY